MDPYTVLEMATINGAKLYGLENQIGSLEIGKKADVIVIKPQILPTPLTVGTVVGHLINTIDGDDVEHVLVDGEFVVKKRQLVTFNEADAASISQAAASKLWERMKEFGPQIDPIRK
jgi:cytosine/adenosine deaminase-related metal-dependent hydrolase